MNLVFSFIAQNLLMGVGLAMDAFSVSLANGLNEPAMKKGKACSVAGIFAVFQFAMPLLGWVCVSTVAQHFSLFEKCIPWMALLLLGYIGGSMLADGIRNRNTDTQKPAVGIKGLLVQGLATSVDALSVGFTIAHYSALQAFLACLLIGIVTFFICCAGIGIGKKAGTLLAGKAGILGGVILLLIGLEIFIKSFF